MFVAVGMYSQAIYMYTCIQHMNTDIHVYMMHKMYTTVPVEQLATYHQQAMYINCLGRL